MKWNKTIPHLILAIVLAGQAWAVEQNNEKALAIVTESKQRDAGWVDASAEMTMTLFDKNGNSVSRELRTMMLEVADDGDKSLTIFDTPHDVKGTVFLNISRVLEPDQQWIYMPALGRIKRIASRNKSGPFLGSEFAYEDVGSFEIGKYDYRYVELEDFQGKPNHVIEYIPKYENSGYTKLKVWLDTKHLRQSKVEYYDRKDSLLKTLLLSDYNLYENRYWRANTKTMVNVQNKNKTILATNKLSFGVDFDPATFHRSGMKHQK
ncbi:outer membrane lipoprotein-sorting protein [Microbulbifer sp. ARAS458-1]|uniref:outer membrane lipoprotein-sorting protein n=1 Tax=Microbulbifer sp. ARAS458-1 TaxID=3140242 RepID=UPI0038782C37